MLGDAVRAVNIESVAAAPGLVASLANGRLVVDGHVFYRRLALSISSDPTARDRP